MSLVQMSYFVSKIGHLDTRCIQSYILCDTEGPDVGVHMLGFRCRGSRCGGSRCPISIARVSIYVVVNIIVIYFSII